MLLGFALSIFLSQVSALDAGRVNIRTLNYFLNSKHLELPCYVPIEISASYNSYSADTSIFGDKWTFSHNIRVVKSLGRFDIIEGDGFKNPYRPERTLEESKRVQVERIMIEQRKADVKKGGLKSATEYQELKDRLLKDAKLRDDTERALVLSPKPLLPGIYYSFERGPSTLELKKDGSFTRRFQTGAYEDFNQKGQLIRSADRSGNFLDYAYQLDQLVRINDMCGRSVNISYQKDPALKNFVASLKDSLNRQVNYTFYPNRLLRSVVSIEGDKTEYTYDKFGNMIALSFTQAGSPQPTQRIELSYNEEWEIATEKGPGEKEVRYKRSFVANNKNHSTTEVIRLSGGKPTSREVHEYKTKEYESITKYDSLGKETSRETKKISAITGYPVSVLNAKGEGELYDYDVKTGNLLKRTIVPSGEVTEFQYDSRCDQQVNALVISQPTEKFIQKIFFNFDQKCNLLDASEVRGPQALVAALKANQLSNLPAGISRSVWITLEYNPRGKIAFLKDRTRNLEIAFTYWQYGKPESITLRDVGTLLVKYRVSGEIEKVDTFPHGKGKARFNNVDPKQVQGQILTEVKTALDSMLNFLKPTGVNIGL